MVGTEGGGSTDAGTAGASSGREGTGVLGVGVTDCGGVIGGVVTSYRSMNPSDDCRAGSASLSASLKPATVQNIHHVHTI